MWDYTLGMINVKVSITMTSVVTCIVSLRFCGCQL